MELTETFEYGQLAPWGATLGIVGNVVNGNYSDAIDKVGQLQDADRAQLVRIIERIREVKRTKGE